MKEDNLPKTGPALFLTAAIGALALFFSFYSLITPDMYKMINPHAMPIGYVFVPSDGEFEGRTHLVVMNILRFAPLDIGPVTIYYRTKYESSFHSSMMQNINNGSNWAGELPSLKKGGRWFYFIEINYKEKSEQKILHIPSWAPDKPLAYVTFKGKPIKVILLFHIIIIMGSAFFLLHSFYFAVNYLKNQASAVAGLFFRKTYNSVFWGWILFTFSAIVLGYYVAWAAFGVGWSGFPIGKDITDNKSLFTVLYWAVLLFLRSGDKFHIGILKNRISEKSFCIWLIAGIILTTVVYLVPHSYFIQ